MERDINQSKIIFLDICFDTKFKIVHHRSTPSPISLNRPEVSECAIHFTSLEII